jgi:hypothetical protein
LLTHVPAYRTRFPARLRRRPAHFTTGEVKIRPGTARITRLRCGGAHQDETLACSTSARRLFARIRQAKSSEAKSRESLQVVSEREADRIDDIVRIIPVSSLRMRRNR